MGKNATCLSFRIHAQHPPTQPPAFMKRFLLLCLLMSSSVFAQTAVSVMVKQHEDRTSNFSERPYGKDDMSYGLFFDLFDGIGGWRFGATYSDDLTGIEGVDSVITPEIALFTIEGIWETSIAILMDYVDTETETDWGDLYYQTHFGANIPVSNSILIGLHAFYPMESVSDIVDIGFNDLDYAVQVRIFF